LDEAPDGLQTYRGIFICTSEKLNSSKLQIGRKGLLVLLPLSMLNTSLAALRAAPSSQAPGDAAQLALPHFRYA
jgi:hypothetical protein